jgi:hypothetical protein
MPVTDHGGPYVCETSRLSHFLYNRLTDGVTSALGAGRPTCLNLAPEGFLVLISLSGRVGPRTIVRLEGLGQLKNPMIS